MDAVKIDIGLSDDSRARIADGLSRLLADSYSPSLPTRG